MAGRSGNMIAVSNFGCGAYLFKVFVFNELTLVLRSNVAVACPEAPQG